jgi:hypothetical protein
MAIVKLKKIMEDLKENTTTAIDVSTITATWPKATSAGNSGTSYKATSAGNAGTSRVAHFASSGTGALAGTHAIFATGL